jgi:hypothetical protein
MAESDDQMADSDDHGPPRGEWRPPSFETAVLRSVRSMAHYRERLESERKPGDPPLSETEVILNSIAFFLKLQGLLIAHMALVPEDGAELPQSAVHAAERVPAWMELRVFGPTVDKPGYNWALGFAQLLAEQRETLTEMVEEHLDEPQPVMEMLAASPVPAGGEGEDAQELFALSMAAMTANFQATLATARQFDVWFEAQLEEWSRELDEDELEDEDEFEAEFEDDEDE